MPNLENYRSKEFHRRFAEALRVRLSPNSTLRLKQLAAGINRSEHSIYRWWHGESRPLAEDIDRMAAFFAKRGDHNFIAAVYGKVKAEADAVSNERMMDFFRKLMTDAASGAAAKGGSPNSSLWFDADGNVAMAPLGHDKYVASVVGLPMSGDLVRYGASLLGWIAATIQPDNSIVLHHDGRRIAPLAAERACEWLRSKRGTTSLVKRTIQVDGNWIDAYHDSPELAAAVLAKIACIVRTARQRWKVTQLPLDKVEHPRLRRLLQIYHEAPDKIIHAAADMGAFTVSGVFSVDGEDVVSHHVPTEYHDLDPRLIEGKNVLSRADTDYALMIRARLIKAKNEGATYHDLSGSVNNFNVHYCSLALAEPGRNGRVLSSTVVLDMQPVG